MSNESKNVNMFGNLDLDKNITFYRCRIRANVWIEEIHLLFQVTSSLLF